MSFNPFNQPTKQVNLMNTKVKSEHFSMPVILSSGQPCILVISSVEPKPTGAGNILLHRHLKQAEGWDVKVVPNPSSNLIKSTLKRLQRTRFHRWANDLEVLLSGRNWENRIKLNQPLETKTIVLTVAHEDGCLAALRFAKKYELPLVTFFNDWWPDFLSVHNPFQQLLNEQFKNLYLESDLAFCASEGMKKNLGSHPNSHVLYGIPANFNENLIPNTPINESESKFRLLYFGNLYEYGEIVASLLKEIKTHTSIQFQVRGANPNWTETFKGEMASSGLWLDFAPREKLDQWLAEADAFLVTMSFDPALQRRMETSFPTKMAEYAQLGKPLVIWGPDYCSAIQWGMNGDRAVCVTDKDPKALVAAVEYLQQSPDLLKYYSQQSKIASQTEFNPVNLQQYFLEAISKLGEFETK